MIRRGTIDDVDDLVELAKLAHSLSPYKSVAYDETQIRRIALLSVSTDLMVCFVSDRNGVVGVLIGGLGPNIWGAMTASDHMVFVKEPGDGPGLVKAFHEWANQFGVLITMTNSFGDERYDRFLEGLGMMCIGKQFIGGFK